MSDTVTVVWNSGMLVKVIDARATNHRSTIGGNFGEFPKDVYHD